MTEHPIPIRSEQGIRDFYDAFSRSDFSIMSRMLRADCSLEFPGSSFPNKVAGRDNIIGLFRNIQAGFDGSLCFHTKWAMHQPQASAGDMIAAHWYTTGRMANGGRYMNRGVAWFRLESGVIIEFLDFLDTEIIAAFFPGGAPASNLVLANGLVKRLSEFAPADAIDRLNNLDA